MVDFRISAEARRSMANQAPEKLSPSKQAARRVGSDLNDKWHIDRVLGVGGMGAVFAATHKNNGTRAAIKVLHIEYARAQDVRERFLREDGSRTRGQRRRVPWSRRPSATARLMGGAARRDDAGRLYAWRREMPSRTARNVTRSRPVAKGHEIDIFTRYQAANIFLSKRAA